MTTTVDPGGLTLDLSALADTLETFQRRNQPDNWLVEVARRDNAPLVDIRQLTDLDPFKGPPLPGVYLNNLPKGRVTLANRCVVCGGDTAPERERCAGCRP